MMPAKTCAQALSDRASSEARVKSEVSAREALFQTMRRCRRSAMR